MALSIADAFAAAMPQAPRYPEITEPWDLWKAGAADDFEATLLEADAVDREAAGDQVGAHRLRREIEKLRRRGSELRALADHWRELRGE